MRLFDLDGWSNGRWERIAAYSFPHESAVRTTLSYVDVGWVVRSHEVDTSDVRYYGPEGSTIPGEYVPSTEGAWRGLDGFWRSLGVPSQSKAALFVGSVLIWCAVIGVWPGIVIALGVLVHEYAHLAAAYGYGVRHLSHPKFIVVGAYVRIDPSHISHRQSGWVFLAGPLSGIPLALLFGLCGVMWGEPVLYLFAGATAYFNLLNLLPVPFPLDGTQILLSAVNAGDRAAKMAVASVVGFAWLNLGFAWIIMPLAFIALVAVGAALTPGGPSMSEATAITDARISEPDDWKRGPAKWLIPAYMMTVLALLGLTTVFFGQDGVLDTMFDVGFILLGFGG